MPSPTLTPHPPTAPEAPLAPEAPPAAETLLIPGHAGWPALG